MTEVLVYIDRIGKTADGTVVEVSLVQSGNVKKSKYVFNGEPEYEYIKKMITKDIKNKSVSEASEKKFMVQI